MIAERCPYQHLLITAMEPASQLGMGLCTTNLVVAGKLWLLRWLVWTGIALRAKGGVVICEVDPVKALALMDSYTVMPALKRRIGDLFIAVTGCKDVLRAPFALMKDGALLANAGILMWKSTRRPEGDGDGGY